MLTPDILFDSYRDITPAFLQSQGVTLLLTDLDYTLAPKAVRRPDEGLRQWINGLKDAGITVMIAIPTCRTTLNAALNMKRPTISCAALTK